MKTILLFTIDLTASRIGEVTVPEGSQILALRLIKGTLDIWFLADEPVNPTTITRTFAAHVTGEVIDTYKKYIGTFHDGPTVWHVFEVQAA